MKKLVTLGVKATEIGVLALTYGHFALADDTNCSDPTGGSITQGAACAAPTGAKTTLFGTGGIFSVITNTLIFIVGAVSVIMLILGGLRYVLSSGNSSSVEGAKNTILYAIIGLVVAVLAYAIVNFVLTRLGAS